MKHLLRISVSLGMLAIASSAFAHARLQNSTPANDAVVSSAPTELRFAYNEAIEPAMSLVKLLGPDSKPVSIEKVEISQEDDKVLLVKVPRLLPGLYRAQWSTMGHDGHPTKGVIRFTVK
jgi:methionine-rich copper-binding protein CopC